MRYGCNRNQFQNDNINYPQWAIDISWLLLIATAARRTTLNTICSPLTTNQYYE
jgi:hypothetical protein